MFWREQAGRHYLIRMSASGAQKSLGADTPENRQIHARFSERKAMAESRVQSLKSALKEQQRLNRALRVGRVPNVLVATSGAMARMHTIHPADFACIKRALAARLDRDPLKKSKDQLQAEVVEQLVAQYLPQFEQG